MKWARAASAAVMAALLAACGAPVQEDAASSASGAPAPEGSADQAREGTVFDDMVGTQDRARAVEDVAAERQRELQRTLEDAEGK